MSRAMGWARHRHEHAQERHTHRLTSRVPLATLLADINGVLTDLTDEHMFATVAREDL